VRRKQSCPNTSSEKESPDSKSELVVACHLLSLGTPIDAACDRPGPRPSRLHLLSHCSPQ
jgi:hypothetical protein